MKLGPFLYSRILPSALIALFIFQAFRMAIEGYAPWFPFVAISGFASLVFYVNEWKKQRMTLRERTVWAQFLPLVAALGGLLAVVRLN